MLNTSTHYVTEMFGDPLPENLQRLNDSREISFTDVGRARYFAGDRFIDVTPHILKYFEREIGKDRYEHNAARDSKQFLKYLCNKYPGPDHAITPVNLRLQFDDEFKKFKITRDTKKEQNGKRAQVAIIGGGILAAAGVMCALQPNHRDIQPGDSDTPAPNVQAANTDGSDIFQAPKNTDWTNRAAAPATNTAGIKR